MNDDHFADRVAWLPHPNKLLVIEPIDYPNPYDYHRPHRHDYFEIILIQKGTGNQYIDFMPFEMRGGQVFTVYPGQVHLMHRHTAEGLLIQFRKDLFEYIRPLQHYHFYFINPVFNLDTPSFERLYNMAEQMAELLTKKDLSPLALYKSYSYLEIILISLAEMRRDDISEGNDHLASQFLSLLSQNIYTRKKVADYCEMMKCSREKLAVACKTAFGKSALELIHEELLLEIRRLLLIGELSLKEIAFVLNFDSPANFSIFIKNKMGLTPSELQASILKNS